MIRKLSLTTILVAVAAVASPAFAQKQRLAGLDANGNLDSLVARHAAANGVPEDLVRRVIKRESGGNPRVVSAGNYGLMQIKLATARSMGYTGNAAGLLDADTNMTYAVKYLAGAYKAANGSSGQRCIIMPLVIITRPSARALRWRRTIRALDSYASPHRRAALNSHRSKCARPSSERERRIFIESVQRPSRLSLIAATTA